MTPEEILAELEAIAAVGQGPDGFATMEEMLVAGLARGKSESAVRKLLKQALRASRVQTQMVPRANHFGVTQGRPGYRILPAKPA
jgi:hypothetical protein